MDSGEAVMQPEQQDIEEEFDLSDIMGEQVGSSLSTEERLKQIEQEEQVRLGLPRLMARQMEPAECHTSCRPGCRAIVIQPSAGIF